MGQIKTNIDDFLIEDGKLTGYTGKEEAISIPNSVESIEEPPLKIVTL